MRKRYLVFLVLFPAGLPALWSADTVVEEIVARVNNSIISSSDFLRSKEQLKEELKQQDPGNADALMLLGQCHTGTPSWQGRSVNGGQVDCVRQELAKVGLPATTPIWDTEGSWGSAGNGSLTIDQKEAYVATYYLIAWSLGVSRQEWYAWDNQGFGTLCAGNAPCVPNAAATAYAQTYAWMVGNVMTKRCASTGTVWTCELTRPDGTRTLAVWDVANASAFAVPAGYTRYADLTGNVAAVMNGTITLGVKPVLLEP